MAELIAYLPDLLAVSIDMYLSFKTFQLFYWLWTNQVPPNKRIAPTPPPPPVMPDIMALTYPMTPLEKPQYSWTSMIDRSLTYYPEVGYTTRGAPISDYKNVYDHIEKTQPITSPLLYELPSPDKFHPPDGAIGFRIGCVEQPFYTNCVTIDYIRPTDQDMISYSTRDKDITSLIPDNHNFPTSINNFGDYVNHIKSQNGGTIPTESVSQMMARLNSKPALR